MRERDALRLGGDENVEIGSLVEQGLRGDLGELDVAEDDERADIEVVGQRAERQVALETRDIYSVEFFHNVIVPF